MNKKPSEIHLKQDKRVILTIFWSGMASILSFLINFMITPLVTNRLGTEAYGYVSLANNFISYATILTTALNAFATRYISIEYHKNNTKKTITYFNSVLFANIIIGLIILFVMSLVIWKIEVLIVIPSELIRDVKLLFVFMFLNFFALLLGNTFLAAAYIKNRLDWAGFFKTLGYFMEIILLVVLFYFFSPMVSYVGVGYFVCSLIILVSSYFMYKLLTPEIKINRRMFSFAAAKKLVIDGIWNSINSLGNVLNSGLDLIITNLMLSPLLMGQLSIAKTMGNILCMMYQIVSQAFQPILLKTYAQNQKETLLQELKISMKASGLISGLFFVGFFCLGKDFLSLWIPDQNTEVIYELTVITLLSYVLEGIVGPLYYIYTLTIKNKVPCIITITGGVVNLGIKFLLLKYTNLGAFAVVISTSAIMLFINLVTNPLYMSHCLKMKWYIFYPTIFRYIIYNLISIFILSIILSKKNVTGWFSFGVYGIFICVVGCVLYFFIVLNNSERKRLFKKIANKKFE